MSIFSKKINSALIVILAISIILLLPNQVSAGTTCLGGKGECHLDDHSGENAGLVYCSDINGSNSECDQYYYCYAANYSMCSDTSSSANSVQKSNSTNRQICNVSGPPAPGYENSPTDCSQGQYLVAYNDGTGVVSACYQIPSGYVRDGLCNVKPAPVSNTRNICGVSGAAAPGYENSPTDCSQGQYLVAYNDGTGVVSACYQIPSGYERGNDICSLRAIATPVNPSTPQPLPIAPVQTQPSFRTPPPIPPTQPITPVTPPPSSNAPTVSAPPQLTVTSISVIDSQGNIKKLTTPQISSEINFSLPVDKTQTVDSPVTILVTYSDGGSKTYKLNFHYSPTQQPVASGETAHLTKCQEITQPGHYELDSDLSADNGQSSCINIHDTQNVQLDCKGHIIPADESSSSTDLAGAALVVKNVNNFTIKSCNIKLLTNKQTFFNSIPIRVIDAQNGQISNNVIDPYYFFVTDSQNLKIFKNTSNAVYQQSNSSNITLDSNNFKEAYHSASGAAAVIILNGNKTDKDTVPSNNAVINNTIDGNSDGIFHAKSDENIGADDGIVISKEIGDIVRNNTISNNWDCAIETLNFIKLAQIVGNTLINSGYCGIGAWYWNSWLNNTVSQNIINGAYQMFSFYRVYQLQDEDVVYFKDNSFDSNIFKNEKISENQAGFWNLSTNIDMSHNTAGNNPNLNQPIPADKWVLGNNNFSNNDFGLNKSPLFKPATMIVDGGGNICKKNDDQSDFPINCSGQSQSVTTQSNAQNTVQSQNLAQAQILKEQTAQPLSSTQQTTSAISYDLNSDGVVNSIDVSKFIQIWQSAKYDPAIDFNHDGKVNSLDWALMKKGLK